MGNKARKVGKKAAFGSRLHCDFPFCVLRPGAKRLAVCEKTLPFFFDGYGH
jgi:hypothetical protein